MRARIAAIKRRMDLFFRPESCQNPWPADSSKVMESWFSVLDYHPCAVADNLIQGIEIWLHNYGCQGEVLSFFIFIKILFSDVFFENVEIMFDTSKMKPSRIERLVARRRKTILKKNSKIAETPCKDKFYDPETTTNIATTWSTVTTPADTTTSTGPQTSTTTTAWESTTSTTPWASTPWTDNIFFGF